MNNVIEVLQARGFIEQISSEEIVEKVKKPLKVYVGFDPTADSLHLGNLVGIMGLAWFQKMGHIPYVILGGATGRIGDPSGKTSERPVLEDETLQYNVRKLEDFFHTILDFENANNRAVILNNEDWYKNFSFIDFLREVGRYFRMGPMLAKDSVKTRLQSEEGMSFTEFSYQMLQGYDFYYLNEKHDVTVQMGGSDQWGNITAGTEFIRKRNKASVYGVTFPLLTRSDGKKFGKSEEGAIWLSAEKLSPYRFYQYLVQVPDADVIRYLKILTFLDLDKIDALEKQMQESSYAPNTVQKILAEEVTRFVHGEEGVEAALRATEAAKPGSDAVLSASALEQAKNDMPHAFVKSSDVIGKKFVDVVADLGLLNSKSEAVRLIKNGGAYLNNERISDPQFVFSEKNIIEKMYLLISIGKKKKMLLELKN